MFFSCKHARQTNQKTSANACLNSMPILQQCSEKLMVLLYMSRIWVKHFHFNNAHEVILCTYCTAILMLLSIFTLLIYHALYCCSRTENMSVKTMLVFSNGKNNYSWKFNVESSFTLVTVWWDNKVGWISSDSNSLERSCHTCYDLYLTSRVARFCERNKQQGLRQ